MRTVRFFAPALGLIVVATLSWFWLAAAGRAREGIDVDDCVDDCIDQGGRKSECKDKCKAEAAAAEEELTAGERVCGRRDDRGRGLICDRKTKRWMNKEKHGKYKRQRRVTDKHTKYANDESQGCRGTSRLRLSYDGKFTCIKNEHCFAMGGKNVPIRGSDGSEGWACKCVENSSWDSGAKECRCNSGYEPNKQEGKFMQCESTWNAKDLQGS